MFDFQVMALDDRLLHIGKASLLWGPIGKAAVAPPDNKSLSRSAASCPEQISHSKTKIRGWRI
jgi:hypothetical protein